MKLHVTSPADAAAAIVSARFGPPPPRGRRTGALLPHQADAVERILQCLRTYNGALLADSVGLGKTVVAVEVARRLRSQQTARRKDEPHARVRMPSARVLVIAPAALRRHWQRHLHGSAWWQFRSHTSLSRGAVPAGPWTLIIVDEAHAFRNPRTQRYAALQQLMPARLLLLTATPVNNSLLDLYALLRLFIGNADFAEFGIPDLAAVMTQPGRRPPASILRTIASQVVIRRTRRVLDTLYGAAGPEHGLRFPRNHGVVLLKHTLRDTHPELLQLLARAQDSLAFPVHCSTGIDVGTRALLFMGLLKRLDSSIAAFRSSLELFVDVVDRAEQAARVGRLMTARDARLLDIGRAQQTFDALLFPPWPGHLDRTKYLAGLACERTVLIALLNACTGDEERFTILDNLLTSELRDCRVVIFTEYRRTAEQLWSHLVRRHRTGLIHGFDARLGLARSSRRAVIERFAPIANGAAPPVPQQAVRVLIATDVIAEGMNLQDARAVISWDLPWNPVRLAQRIGRIDRLGSPHHEIHAFAFRPDPDIDRMLRLVQRIRSKIRDARSVGSDTPRTRRVTEPERSRVGASNRSGAPARDPSASAGDTATSIVTTSTATANAATSSAATSSVATATACIGVAGDGFDAWERAELLRATVARMGRTTAPADAGVPVGCLCWNGPPAVLVCAVLHGEADVRMLPCEPDPAGGRWNRDRAIVDRILLTALHLAPHEHLSGIEPTLSATAWEDWESTVRHAFRDAANALRCTRSRRAIPRRRPERAFGRLVLQWLASRPGGASPDEYADATRCLDLAAAADDGTIRHATGLFRSAAPDAATVAARLLAAGRGAAVRSRPDRAPQMSDPAPRPVAALLLLPVHGTAQDPPSRPESAR